MQRIRKPVRSLATLSLFVAVLSREVIASGTALLAQNATPVSNVTSGRSFTVEIGIVVVMFGAALFAVCRSSNRT